MKHSIFLIAHPRKSTLPVEFLNSIQLSSEFGDLLETIDVFCINAENFENCRHLLAETKDFLAALPTENQDVIELWQDQLQVLNNFEHALQLIDAEGTFLLSDKCPDALQRCVSDKTRMRCDRGWSMYLTDKTA